MDTDGVNAPREGPYRNAPIVEALIDVRVEPRPDLALPELRDVMQASSFAPPEEIFSIEGHLAVGPQAVSTGSSRQHVGYLHKSIDGAQIWQARRDGCSYTALGPYDRWDTFVAEALTCWQQYEAVSRPVAVYQLGVRYINRIVCPAGPVRLEDYLRTYPEISRDLPQEINGYFFNVGLPMAHLNAHVNLIETIVTSDGEVEDPADLGKEASQAVILDIDAQRSLFHELDGPASAWLGEELATLRQAKNEVFEASITDATRRMFL